MGLMAHSKRKPTKKQMRTVRNARLKKIAAVVVTLVIVAVIIGIGLWMPVANRTPVAVLAEGNTYNNPTGSSAQGNDNTPEGYPVEDSSANQSTDPSTNHSTSPNEINSSQNTTNSNNANGVGSVGDNSDNRIDQSNQPSYGDDRIAYDNCQSDNPCNNYNCILCAPPFNPHATIPTDTPGVYRAPTIALTFDDGPGRNTIYLLDILDHYGGRVTFCVIGNLVENGAETVRRAHEAGHEIVGHSWNHRDLARLTIEEISEQIIHTNEIIEYVTGEPVIPLFRVPFGHFNRPIQQAAIATGHGVLNWSIDPRDWYFRDAERIYEFIMETARDGAIIVLHDVHYFTIEAMRLVIPALKERGFELVTASEIIYQVYGGIEPGFEFTGTRR